jgi:multiple inositol-polyphosphate phosphatase/2,3-bisphosphoglycerate 3-phosphatase
MHICCLPVIAVFAFVSFLGESCRSFQFGQHLATKTPYPLFEANNYTKAPDGCHILHLDYVGRHGSRAPTVSDIKRLTTLQATIRRHKDLLHNTNYSWLLNWTNPYKPFQAGNLEVLGELEQYTIAKRFALLYNITAPSVDNAYPIQTTMIPRAARSGNAFGFGLFEGKGELGRDNFKPFYIFSESLERDVTLRFFDICPLYIQTILNSGDTIAEYTRFVREQLPKVAGNVSNRLGVFPLWNLTVDEIDAIYTACTFEYAKSNVTDRWCSLFSDDDFLTLEYAEDLINYWTKGYGYELNYRIACPLLKEIIVIMDGKINRSAEYFVELGKFRFAHAETLLPLIALLGLYRDDAPLRANSSLECIQNRKWRTSVISPYAANLAFILYECNSTSTANASQYLVKLIHNEKEMFIPGCENNIYCPYTTFKSKYLSALDCDFEKLCGIKRPQCLTAAKSISFGWFEFALGIGGFILGLSFVIVLYFKQKIKDERRPRNYEQLN